MIPHVYVNKISNGYPVGSHKYRKPGKCVCLNWITGIWKFNLSGKFHVTVVFSNVLFLSLFKKICRDCTPSLLWKSFVWSTLFNYFIPAYPTESLYIYTIFFKHRTNTRKITITLISIVLISVLEQILLFEILFCSEFEI